MTSVATSPIKRLYATFAVSRNGVAALADNILTNDMTEDGTRTGWLAVVDFGGFLLGPTVALKTSVAEAPCSPLSPANDTITAGPSPTATGSGALTQILYLQESGTTAPISVTDINQGQIGDCYLCSSIGELALFHPNWITKMIHANTDGTETVTLYTAANGTLPTWGTTSFKPYAVTVTNTFPVGCVNNGSTQDVLNGQKEIWVQVLEKAVSTLYGGYSGIAYGGWPSIAMEELTGCTANFSWSSSVSLQQLQNAVNAGDLITFDTLSSSNLAYHLVANHAYMFKSLSTLNGNVVVNLLNPWGFNQPDPIPFFRIGSVFQGIDIGQFVDNGIIPGTPGNDVVTLSAILTNGYVDLSSGKDSFTLANGTNSAKIANVETILGGTGNDTITLATAAAGAMMDLRGGNDSLRLANVSNSLTVANVETIIGGTGADSVILATALTGAMTIDLGGGPDRLTLTANGNTGTVRNVEALAGGGGSDTITFSTVVNGAAIDLGGGTDTLRLANATNSAIIANVETIYGGSGNDTITLGAAANQATINPGAGTDKLILGNFVNTASIANAETISGGNATDVITLMSALTDACSIDLGAGNDTLILGNMVNAGTISNVETIYGGNGNDTVTLGTAASYVTVDLSGGSDKLTLGNFTDNVTVSNVETIVGGAGNDTIAVTGSIAATVIGGGGINFISGGTGGDTFVLNQASNNNYSVVKNFGTGDKIGLDVKGLSNLGADVYNLSGARLSDLRTITQVSDTAGRLATTLNNGSGAFVYQQNSGALYYSASGKFSGGGLEIGIITIDGSTPWTYDASRFVAL